MVVIINTLIGGAAAKPPCVSHEKLITPFKWWFVAERAFFLKLSQERKCLPTLTPFKWWWFVFTCWRPQCYIRLTGGARLEVRPRGTQSLEHRVRGVNLCSFKKKNTVSTTACICTLSRHQYRYIYLFACAAELRARGTHKHAQKYICAENTPNSNTYQWQAQGGREAAHHQQIYTSVCCCWAACTKRSQHTRARTRVAW